MEGGPAAQTLTPTPALGAPESPADTSRCFTSKLVSLRAHTSTHGAAKTSGDNFRGEHNKMEIYIYI